MVILVSMLPASLPWASPMGHAKIVGGTADTPIRDVGQLDPPFGTVQKEMILTFVHNQPAVLAGGHRRNEPWTQITLRRIDGWRKITPVVSLHTAVAA